MDCAQYFSSPKAPIFVTGTKLSIAIQSLEACSVFVNEKDEIDDAQISERHKLLLGWRTILSSA